MCEAVTEGAAQQKTPRQRASLGAPYVVKLVAVVIAVSPRA